MLLELGERSLMIAVDRGTRRIRYTLPAAPRWDDNGESLPPELAANLQSIITEISLFWEQQPEFLIVGHGVRDA
jgi:hypothetical protein